VVVGTGGAFAQSEPRNGSKSNRMVLVDLYTSQGCDMCPAAEAILGALAKLLLEGYRDRHTTDALVDKAKAVKCAIADTREE
jgi:hypothetical protein